MIILTGKSGSGKDTIRKELINNYGYQSIITYTTRPKRRGEKDGVNYHFITEEDFKNKIEEGFFAEYKTYQVANGDIWYYGCSVADIENPKSDKTVIILTPEGVKDVMNNTDLSAQVFYIYANQATIVERLKSRGDNKNEAERRIKHDNEDFKGWENQVDKIIYNNINNNIKDVVNKLLQCVDE